MEQTGREVSGEPERHETVAERYDRNWSELLQELRVTQTGVQILAGFLLTLPFGARFVHLTEGYRILFLVAFGLACLSIVLIVAPVSAHRLLFGRHEKGPLVHLAGLLVKLGLVALALTLSAVVTLIFGVVAGMVTGVAAGVVSLLVFATVWVVVPRLSVSAVRRG